MRVWGGGSKPRPELVGQAGEAAELTEPGLWSQTAWLQIWLSHFLGHLGDTATDQLHQHPFNRRAFRHFKVEKATVAATLAPPGI